MSQKHLTDQRFTDLELPPALQAGIVQAGFEFLTPIQARVLPPLLEQHDVAGQAQTGTGKTAAFLIAMFNRLENAPPSEPVGPRALILAPTRELAIQIYKDAQILCSHLPYRLALAYGGTGYDTQRRQLEQGFDVLIGTPGRTIDYYKQGIFTLKSIEVMVLDEADRMFDLGFIRDIRYVLRRMPEPQKRLSMLFSATLSLRVNELAYEHMNNPQSIKVESEFATVDAVEQQVYFPANDEKIPLLIGLLKDVDPSRTLIFSNTKQTAELLGAWLTGNSFSAGVLSGDVPQKKRERLLQQFKQGDIAILVATDVAARGLHIPDVSHVINFDLPQDPEDYVHRVGRTARAGARGDAISFACETHAFSLADIEQFVGHKVAVAAFDAGSLAVPDPPAPLSDRKRTRGSSATERPKDRHRDKHGKARHSRDTGGIPRQNKEPKQRSEPPQQRQSAQTPPEQAVAPQPQEPVHDEPAKTASDPSSGTRRREIPAIG